MYDDIPIEELKLQIEESNRILNELNLQISDLKSKAKKGENTANKNYHNIIIEKQRLKKDKKNNKKVIQNYKSQLIELQNKVQSQNNILNILTKENQELKARNIRKLKKSPEKKIKDISDLGKSFGLGFKDNFNIEKNIHKNDDENEEGLSQGYNINEKEDEFQKLKKTKIDLEKIFHKLQDNIISFNKKIDNQITYYKL